MTKSFVSHWLLPRTTETANEGAKKKKGGGREDNRKATYILLTFLSAFFVATAYLPSVIMHGSVVLSWRNGKVVDLGEKNTSVSLCPFFATLSLMIIIVT